MKITKVESLDTPELRPYRTLRMSKEHWYEGIFVAEGEKVVRRLLQSPLEIKSLLITEEWLESLRNSSELESRSVDVFIAPKHTLEEIVGFNLHQGIMAIAKMPGNKYLDQLFEHTGKQRLLVALDGLANAENVGVIIRNCAAFGVDGVIVGEKSSSPYLRRAVRNSMGAVFNLSVAHVSNLPDALRDVRERFAVDIIAAHPGGTETLYDHQFTGDVCIVLGNEGEGISEPVLKVCKTRLAIPMMKDTDSLNVGSASAVFLFAARTALNRATP